MRFSETPLAGVWEIDLELLGDERGWFARGFDVDEFGRRGLELEVVQANSSFNAARDTLRGLHYQADPHGEPKLVRCVAGAVFDVAVDLRPESPTFRAWFGLELSDSNQRILWIPPGLAHGFLTLSEEADLLYRCTDYYEAQSEGAVRWNDPDLAIDWPLTGAPVLSPRDAAAPLLAEALG